MTKYSYAPLSFFIYIFISEVTKPNVNSVIVLYLETIICINLLINEEWFSNPLSYYPFLIYSIWGISLINRLLNYLWALKRFPNVSYLNIFKNHNFKSIVSSCTEQFTLAFRFLYAFLLIRFILRFNCHSFYLNQIF